MPRRTFYKSSAQTGQNLSTRPRSAAPSAVPHVVLLDLPRSIRERIWRLCLGNVKQPQINLTPCKPFASQCGPRNNNLSPRDSKISLLLVNRRVLLEARPILYAATVFHVGIDIGDYISEERREWIFDCSHNSKFRFSRAERLRIMLWFDESHVRSSNNSFEIEYGPEVSDEKCFYDLTRMPDIWIQLFSNAIILPESICMLSFKRVRFTEPEICALEQLLDFFGARWDITSSEWVARSEPGNGQYWADIGLCGPPEALRRHKLVLQDRFSLNPADRMAAFVDNAWADFDDVYDYAEVDGDTGHWPFVRQPHRHRRHRNTLAAAPVTTSTSCRLSFA